MNTAQSISQGITSKAHPLWIAYILHRVSGVALTLFLPLHFWILAMALSEPEKLDGFLNMTNHLVVKLAELGLVFLLAVHMFGGLRLLAMEWLPWTPSQKTLAAMAVALSFFIGIAFFLKAL